VLYQGFCLEAKVAASGQTAVEGQVQNMQLSDDISIMQAVQDKIKIVSCARLLAQAIVSINSGQSVSSLFAVGIFLVSVSLGCDFVSLSLYCGSSLLCVSLWDTMAAPRGGGKSCTRQTRQRESAAPHPAPNARGGAGILGL
jgi:hypothetical protein